jgi:hypothetical protein
MTKTDLLSLPFWLHRGTAFVTFAFAIFMIAAHAAIAAMGAQRGVLSPKTKTAVPFVVCDRDYRWRWIELPYSARIAPAH